MYPLRNPVQNYAWGSRTALAELRGAPTPSPEPEAELWLGAHPGGPSRVLVEGSDRSLADVIAMDPEQLLGPQSLALFGPRLPFLLKVLAVDQPLSLQAHPDLKQAQSGYAAEQDRGVASTDPARNYRDPNHKPELLCALTPFDLLTGLRPLEEIEALLGDLGTPQGRFTPHTGAAQLIGQILRTPDPRGLVSAAVDSCHRQAAEGTATAQHHCALDLAERYPDDPGVIVSLLLNHVHLEPGEAMYTPPRRLHAYLRGVGIEIMAASDNVLRGGLTAKHVDVAELMTVLEPGPARPRIIRAEPARSGWSHYPAPARDFALARAELIGEPVTSRVPGPQILLCTHGRLQLSDAAGGQPLERGRAVFVAAGDAITCSGAGTAYRATVA